MGESEKQVEEVGSGVAEAKQWGDLCINLFNLKFIILNILIWECNVGSLIQQMIRDGLNQPIDPFFINLFLIF